MSIVTIFEKSDKLKRILLLPFEGDKNFITDILLFFSKSQIIKLSAIAETDEIYISLNKNDDNNLNRYVDASSYHPWIKEYYNANALLFWVMENYKGYTDAIQFEFTKKNIGVDFVIQFKVIASNINIYEVKFKEAI